jgi:nucleoid-associated protein YgaU
MVVRRRPRRAARIRCRRRRVAWTLALTLLGGIAWAAGAWAKPSASAPRQVVVQPGDTLWGLAERYAPAGTDPRRWAAEVERLNGLPGGRLLAGQVLLLPR